MPLERSRGKRIEEICARGQTAAGFWPGLRAIWRSPSERWQITLAGGCSISAGCGVAELVAAAVTVVDALLSGAARTGMPASPNAETKITAAKTRVVRMSSPLEKEQAPVNIMRWERLNKCFFQRASPEALQVTVSACRFITMARAKAGKFGGIARVQ